MSGEGKFEFDSIQDADSIKDFFGSLMRCFENKRIILNNGTEEIIMHPGPLLHFEVKAKRKGLESKISIKIEWTDSKRETKSTSQAIAISS